jgi:hypothetical protein
MNIKIPITTSLSTFDNETAIEPLDNPKFHSNNQFNYRQLLSNSYKQTIDISDYENSILSKDGRLLYIKDKKLFIENGNNDTMIYDMTNLNGITKPVLSEYEAITVTEDELFLLAADIQGDKIILNKLDAVTLEVIDSIELDYIPITSRSLTLIARG